MIAVIHMACFSQYAIAQTVSPSPAMTPELRDASFVFAKYWADSFDALIKVMSESGIPNPRKLFPKDAIPSAKKALDALIIHTKERPDIQDAALLILSAYEYASDNIVLAKDKRRPTKNAKLAELLGAYPDGITEGYLVKNIMIARMRFNKLVEIPAMTEEQVKAMPDFDYYREVKLPGARPAKQSPLSNEHHVEIKKNGSILLDGKSVSLDDLPDSLTKLKTKQGETGISVSLKTNKAVKYARVKEIMVAIGKAGVERVTFLVQDAE